MMSLNNSECSHVHGSSVLTFIIQGTRNIAKEETKMNSSPGGQGRVLWKAILWTQQEHNSYELTEYVITCIKSSQLKFSHRCKEEDLKMRQTSLRNYSQFVTAVGEKVIHLWRMALLGQRPHMCAYGQN